jgi:hypothetical protein
MESAQNYGRYKSSAIIQLHVSHMTTTLSQSFTPKEELPAAADRKFGLFEPLLVVGACVFWLAVLPITGLFCASVAIYDKVASLRWPDLRYNAAHNPLVLRKKSERKQPMASHRHTASQALQS